MLELLCLKGSIIFPYQDTHRILIAVYSKCEASIHRGNVANGAQDSDSQHCSATQASENIES